MKTFATKTLRIAIATALIAGLSACGDKPPQTTPPATPDAPATPDSPAPAEPAAATPAPAPDAAKAPTARDLINAAPHSLPQAQPAPPDDVGESTPEETADPSSPPPESDSAMPTDEPGGSPPPAEPSQSDSSSTESAPRYAKVVSVQPVKHTAERKREVCRDERIVHRARPKDDRQIAGTVIGAIAGGVIGNQVGRGHGRDLATVAGAIGGGYAGKKIQERQQDGNTYVTTQRRCREVKEPAREVVDYDVVYEYLGQTQKVRLDHDPGDRVELPVRGVE